MLLNHRSGVYPDTLIGMLREVFDHGTLNLTFKRMERSIFHSETAILLRIYDECLARQHARDICAKGNMYQLRHPVGDWSTVTRCDHKSSVCGSPPTSAVAKLKYLKEVDE